MTCSYNRPAPDTCYFYMPALSACQFFLPACSFYRPVPINGMLFLQACPFYRLVAACPLNQLVPTLGLFLLPAFSLYWRQTVLCTASSLSLLSLLPIRSFHLFTLLSRSFYRPVPYTGLVLRLACSFYQPFPYTGGQLFFVPPLRSLSSPFFLSVPFTCSFYCHVPSTGRFLIPACSFYGLFLLPACSFYGLFLLPACSFYRPVPSMQAWINMNVLRMLSRV
jgi:hypothetical protein